IIVLSSTLNCLYIFPMQHFLPKMLHLVFERATILTVDYSLARLEKVEKQIVVMAGNRRIELEIPTIGNVSSSGAAMFKKGEIKKVGAWLDGHDAYQIRIGIH
ncbi:MAG: hypothetical protein FD173_2312, partial [Gallionellaceae bacterium]